MEDQWLYRLVFGGGATVILGLLLFDVVDAVWLGDRYHVPGEAFGILTAIVAGLAGRIVLRRNGAGKG